MAKFEKEKNLLKFFCDDEDNPKIILDINTGDFFNDNNEKLEYIPDVLVNLICNRVQAMSNVMHFLRIQFSVFETEFQSISVARAKEITMYLNFYDKLDSLGYQGHHTDFYINDALRFFNSHFDIFVKYHKKYNNARLHMLYQYWAKDMFFKENHLFIDKHHFTSEMANILFKMCSPLFYHNPIKNQYVSFAQYYLTKGLYEYEDYEYQIFDKLQDYFHYCESLQLPPEKDIFMRTYSKYKKLYKIYQEELQTTNLIKNQKKHYSALSFSTDKYIVIVPMSIEEIQKEAISQSNCVESYIEEIANGETNIVFVRDINNKEQSLITCEVNEGNIAQYFLKYNQNVEDKELLQFKKLYQKHLKETWKED